MISLSGHLFGRHQGEMEVSGLALKVFDWAVAPLRLHRRQVALDICHTTSQQSVDQPGQLMGGGLDCSPGVHALQTPAMRRAEAVLLLRAVLAAMRSA